MRSRINKASIFSALQNRVYRRLWFASLISGTCVAAHDTAAVWVMHMLGSSAFSISLMSTVASLPLFIFTLPAGVLADMVDRRRLLRSVNLWLAAAAGLPAILGVLQFLSPNLLLTCIFMTAVGFALTAPAWSALVSDIVTKEELPSASALSGLQLNLSGTVGPAMGGLLIYLFGANWVFAVNAACFALMSLVLLKSEPATEESKPADHFFQSFVAAVRYIRISAPIRTVLARNAFFSFFISVIPALMPVVALKELHLRPCSLGLLFTSMGVGSVFGAVFVLPRLREKFSSNATIVLATLLEGAVFVLMAFVRHPLIFMFVAASAGLGWSVAASELWVACQRLSPGWVRGRINASIIMASQGGIAIGGTAWGLLGQVCGVATALILAAVALSVSILVTILRSTKFRSVPTLRKRSGPVRLDVSARRFPARPRLLLRDHARLSNDFFLGNR